MSSYFRSAGFVLLAFGIVFAERAHVVGQGGDWWFAVVLIGIGAALASDPTS